MARSASMAEGVASVSGDGSAGATTAVWAEFAAPLRAFVARRVPPGIDADDVVQEVFLRVVRHLPSLREADRMEGWLYQIARNALRDALRARRRRDGRARPLDGDVPADPPTEDVRAAEAELAPCLAPMVTRLAEPYKSAIELTSLQGLTQSAAARHAGISVSGMKSRVQRARSQLKQMLLHCCQVEVDARGGVADYHRRRGSTGCAGDGGTPAGARRCTPGACDNGQ
jgi:RNA polymerase sigma-70 factor (ECF subfamily)